MASVVIELQRDALDRTIRVSDLLRKSLVVARKLSLGEFQRWIEGELSGYGKGDDIPSYRLAHGQVRAWNPYRGWIPVVFADSRKADVLSKRVCGQSVAELESLIEGDPSGSFHMPFSHAVQQQLSRALTFPTEVTLFVPPTAIVRILDAVRTVILNWSLKLEEDGVVGEGLSFTHEEKEAAGRGPQNVTNFFGPVQSPQIQQGATQPLQVTALDLDTHAVREFVGLLRRELDNLELPAEQRGEAEAELRTIEAQVKSPKPKPLIVREGLQSLRSILENGGGAAVGQILVELGKILF